MCLTSCVIMEVFARDCRLIFGSCFIHLMSLLHFVHNWLIVALADSL
jgi:hypothetical protein